MTRLLLGSLTVLAAAAGCQFGPAPGCVYPCHCMDGAVCDSTTGDCPAGCDDGDPNGYMWRGAWSGPGCQVGNVAYGQSATSADLNNWSTPPARAVDGDRDPNYRYTNGACAYVRANHWLDLYWRVDLGHSYVIYNITVYSTDGTHSDYRNYLTSRVVEVGDESSQYTACGSLGDDNNVQQVDVVCPQPLVGRYVRIRATQFDSSISTPRLYLCEVFIIGYQFEDCSVSGTFGPGCLADCHCRGHCDVISGKCSTQCEDGWVGDDCQQELPVLPSPPIIVKVNETHLELEFAPWGASPGSRDRPSSYVVEIRREGAEDWEELKMLSALESRMIFVTIKHNFQVTAAYEVRVLPILTHEGTDYQGHGVPAAFTVTAPTVQDLSPDHNMESFLMD